MNRFIIYRSVFQFVCLFVSVSVAGQAVINKSVLKSARLFSEVRINTANEESSPAFVGDKVGFVFTRSNFSSDEEANYDVAYARVEADNSLSEKSEFSSRLNSFLHEGPMSYDASTNVLFFTRTHKETRRIRGVDTDTFYLRIMTADLNAAKPVIKPIDLNVDRYSVCHPSLSSDGKTMVYASNQPGGAGGLDLYIAHHDGTGWTAAINAGDRINTPYNDGFPYLLNDTLLVFASQRPGGHGGWDMYACALRNGFWTFPEILPEPVNSPFDDLGLIVRPNGQSGYFASNRPGGYGVDDIYRFSTEKPIFGRVDQPTTEVTVHVMDKLTLEGLPGATVTVFPLEVDIHSFTMSEVNVNVLSGKGTGDLILRLTPKSKENMQKSTADETGLTSIKVLSQKKYLVSVFADHYQPIDLIYDHASFGDQFNVVLEPEDTTVNEEENPQPTAGINAPDAITMPEIPTSSGAVIVFDNIYYDYNSASILPGAAAELDALARAMLENPDMKVRLESHTDSRGTFRYNLQLSIDRANAARKYLSGLGIDEDRISIRGMGESKIRNQCADGVPCTEEMHAYNRRTEVVVE